MSAFTAGIAAYEMYGATIARQAVIETYDRPLMAINFARAASATFSQMENQLLEARLVSDRSAIMAKFEELATSFFEDLAVAKQRSVSAEATEAAHHVQDSVKAWVTDIREAMANKEISLSTVNNLHSVSERVVAEFDRLIEFTAEDGFRERQRSLAELDRTTNSSVAYTFLAMALAGLITVIMSRRIQRPLSEAVRVAEQIGAGDFTAQIPEAGQDEIGSLLRSMHKMQAAIRSMIQQEEAERRSAQRRLLEAIEGSREGMMLVGADGNLIIANAQAAHMLALSSSDLMPGTSFNELISRIVTPNLPDRNCAALLVTEGEVCLRPNLWVRISRNPTQDGGFFLFWSDISTLKEREANLLQAKQEAESASQAKSRFLATMSHELRTPLNAVIGFSEMIASESVGSIGNTKYKEFGELILRSGRHLLDVISGVLDYAKSEAGKDHLRYDIVNLRDIVEDCVEMIGPEAQKCNLELVYTLTPHAVTIHGDAQKLRQMLLNLLSNAVKFTPPQGRVEVLLRVENDGSTLLSVADTGIGMKLEDIPIALTPFGQIDSRLARRYEGTGLGLPLAKSFAEVHGASFDINSQPGTGTKVSIRFPAASQPELATNRAA